MNLNSYFDKQIKKIDRALDAKLPKESEYPARLHQAMRYAVMSGGKRIRPIFTLAACQAVGGNEKKAMPAACALELIHTYSLIHDDLPCMDNDDTRRGKPSCHRKFGEDTALLAGDALLTLAFRVLSETEGSKSAKELKNTLAVVRMIAEAAGTHGMVGGQQVDMEYQDKETDLPTIEYINTHKTGSLIAAAVRAGAFLGGGNEAEQAALYRFGKYTGLLFQIVDDILDEEGYAKVVGVHEARKEAEKILQKAKNEVKRFASRGTVLNKLADFVFERET